MIVLVNFLFLILIYYLIWHFKKEAVASPTKQERSVLSTNLKAASKEVSTKAEMRATLKDRDRKISRNVSSRHKEREMRVGRLTSLTQVEWRL